MKRSKSYWLNNLYLEELQALKFNSSIAFCWVLTYWLNNLYLEELQALKFNSSIAFCWVLSHYAIRDNEAALGVPRLHLKVPYPSNLSLSSHSFSHGDFFVVATDQVSTSERGW
ncbi:hypothetical protein QE152_g39752 [Popillia japonica]|uniref:Uncharacterized protein n=1 Tax=Popillia japonica TaxID=7064 RepID=A0AAW1HTE4_POPJA